MFMLLKNENVEHLSEQNGHFYGRDIEMCLHHQPVILKEHFLCLFYSNSTVVLAYIEVIRFSVKLLVKVDLAFFNQNLVIWIFLKEGFG